MAETVYVMESANLICGDVKVAQQQGPSPGVSTHLVLQELKLPGFEENYVDHAPGGAMVAIEVSTHINRLEATFNLAGWDPAIMSFLGRNDPFYQRFTAYGLIRDRRSSKALQSIAVMEGRLGRVNPTAFSKGNLMAHEYSIRGIVSYRLYMQMVPDGTPEEIYFWDFFTSRFRSGNEEISTDLHTILGVG